MSAGENSADGGENDNPTVTLLVPKKASHSVVWKFFGFKEEDENQKDMTCKLCFATVAAPHGNTTNLYNHLKRHHKVQYDEAVKAKKTTGEIPPGQPPRHQ